MKWMVEKRDEKQCGKTVTLQTEGEMPTEVILKRQSDNDSKTNVQISWCA